MYTDFSKTFDSVNHSLLLLKLYQIGLPNNLLIWIWIYFNGLSQKVIFKNAVSKMIYVTSGVPQGSHLGPLLFTLFINDLPSIVAYSRVLMYDDDLKLWVCSQILIDSRNGVSTPFWIKTIWNAKLWLPIGVPQFHELFSSELFFFFGQTDMARSTRLVILIKNIHIYTLWGRKTFLQPVTYFPTNLIYPLLYE